MYVWYFLFSHFPCTSHECFFTFHLFYAAIVTFKLYPSFKGQLKFANPEIFSFTIYCSDEIYKRNLNMLFSTPELDFKTM